MASRTPQDLFSKFVTKTPKASKHSFQASEVGDIVEDRLKFRRGLGKVETEGHAAKAHPSVGTYSAAIACGMISRRYDKVGTLSDLQFNS